MAAEVLLDTSGFFALMDARDPAHQKARRWLGSQRGRARPVTTEWIVGETSTLRQAPVVICAIVSSETTPASRTICRSTAELPSLSWMKWTFLLSRRVFPLGRAASG